MDEAEIADVLALDQTVALLVLAVGAALVIGNGLAILQNWRGRKPRGEDGEFRGARAYWLFSVGVVMTVWSVLSL